MSFQGNTLNTDKYNITNQDIPANCKYVYCHNAKLNGSLKLAKLRAIEKSWWVAPFQLEPVGIVELHDNVSIKEIISDYYVHLHGHTQAEDISAHRHVELYDNAEAKRITCDTVRASGNSKIKEIWGHSVQLSDNANVKIVDSTYYDTNARIFANKINIEKVISPGNVEIQAKGIVKDILCKGNKIKLVGSLEVKGLIKFAEKGGKILLYENEQGIFPKITGRIINGTLTRV